MPGTFYAGPAFFPQQGGSGISTGYEVYPGGEGSPECVPIVPVADIDYRVTLQVRRDLNAQGLLTGYSVKPLGSCDGYPWHQLVVNGVGFELFDPCDWENTVLELLTNLDHPFVEPQTADGTGFIPIIQ